MLRNLCIAVLAIPCLSACAATYATDEICVGARIAEVDVYEFVDRQLWTAQEELAAAGFTNANQMTCADINPHELPATHAYCAHVERNDWFQGLCRPGIRLPL